MTPGKKGESFKIELNVDWFNGFWGDFHCYCYICEMYTSFFKTATDLMGYYETVHCNCCGGQIGYVGFNEESEEKEIFQL